LEPFLAAEALLQSPRLDQRSVEREGLIAYETPRQPVPLGEETLALRTDRVKRL